LRGLRARRGVGVVGGHVQRQRGAVGDDALRFGQHLQAQQRVAHGRVLGDGRLHLHTFQRVAHGVLRRHLLVAQALQAHVQAGRVHHQEHRRQAAVGLPTSQPVAAS
jgi:hypothetical protein